MTGWLPGQRWNEVERLVYNAILNNQDWLIDNYVIKYNSDQRYDFVPKQSNFGDAVVRFPAIIDGSIKILEISDTWQLLSNVDNVNFANNRAGIVDAIYPGATQTITNRFYNIWAGLSRIEDANGLPIPYLFMTAQPVASLQGGANILHNTAGVNISLVATQPNSKYQFEIGADVFFYSTVNFTYNTGIITDISTSTHALNPVITIDTHNEVYSSDVSGDDVVIVQINKHRPYVVDAALTSYANRLTFPETDPSTYYEGYYLIDSFLQGKGLGAAEFNAIYDMGAYFKRLGTPAEIIIDEEDWDNPIFLVNICPINTFRNRFQMPVVLLDANTEFDINTTDPISSTAVETIFNLSNQAAGARMSIIHEKPFMDSLPLIQMTAISRQRLSLSLIGFYSGKPHFESALTQVATLP